MNPWNANVGNPGWGYPQQQQPQQQQQFRPRAPQATGTQQFYRQQMFNTPQQQNTYEVCSRGEIIICIVILEPSRTFKLVKF